MNDERKDKAISEVLGVILLLVITVTLFSGLSYVVLTYPFHPSPPSVDIVGMLDDKNITLSHRGGEILGLDTEIIVTVGTNRYDDTIGNYLNETYKEDGYWNIGEILVYPVGDVTDLFVYVVIVDVESSSIIMRGTLQEDN